MNINQLYSSGDYLKAADLQGKARVLTIGEWQVTEFDNAGSKDSKIVLGFNGTDRNQHDLVQSIDVRLDRVVALKCLRKGRAGSAWT